MTRDAGDEPVDLLMLDADGRLDRDLITLQEHFAPECELVVDDVGGGARLAIAGEQYRIDLKHEISNLLVDALIAEGALQEIDRVGELFFGRPRIDDLSLERLKDFTIESYRKLVFQDVGRDLVEAWAQLNSPFKDKVRLGRFIVDLGGRQALRDYRALRRFTRS